MAQRRKKRERRINDIVRFQVKHLAAAGFSHRFIASLVFHKSAGRVTQNEINSISGLCSRCGWKVSDYRNGNTRQAASLSTTCMKPPKRRRRQKALRVRRAA